MGPRRRRVGGLWLAGLATAAAGTAFATGAICTQAQAVGPSSTACAGLAEELPSEILTLLATVEDFSFDFDQPGYYAVLKFVREGRFAPGSLRPAVPVSDWQALVERPSDFRGLPVTITGILGRNKDPYVHQRYPELGPVFQAELWRPDQPITCTVVFTQDVRDLPLGATVTVSGYFVKINRYPRQSGEPGLSALIVAPGPLAVSRQTAGTGPAQARWWPLGAAVGVGLLAAFVLLRRAGRSRPTNLRLLKATGPAPASLADDLARWAEAELPEDPEVGRADETAGGPNRADA